MQAVEARELAVLFLQKVLRGRAVQNRVTWLSVHTYVHSVVFPIITHIYVYIRICTYVCW